MLVPVGVAIDFDAMFIASKVGKTGLTVTVDIYRNGSEIVTAGSATELGGGLYTYQLASGSNNAAGRYICIFKTSDTSVDQQQIPSMYIAVSWLASASGVTVTTNNDKTGYELDEGEITAIKSGLSTLDGTDIQTATAAALTAYDPPTKAEMDARTLPTSDYATSVALTTVDGVVDSIAATVSANLDVAVSSRLSASDYVEPLGAEETESAVGAALTAYDPPTKAEMDARTLPTSDYATSAALTTVDGVVDSIAAAIEELTENSDGLRFTEKALEQAPTGSGASAEEIAAAVWDEAISGHLDEGSTGVKLNAAGNAGDPWSTLLPGAYSMGTAGYKVGLLGTTKATVPTLVDDGLDPVAIHLRRGDSYTSASGREIAEFTSSIVESIPAEAVIKLYMENEGSPNNIFILSCDIVNREPVQWQLSPVTAEDTAAFVPGRHDAKFKAEWTDNGEQVVITLLNAIIEVSEDAGDVNP